MFKIMPAVFLVFILFALTVQPAFAERPLEDASYSEGMKAIAEMHVLDQLGLAGEFINIYRALNQASYAAAILHDRKWIPGDDDLSWVDDPNYGKIRHDPLAGLLPDDKRIVKRRLGDIQRFNKMLESGDYANVDEKNEILQGIKEQVESLKRTLSDYPDFYAKAFPLKDSSRNLSVCKSFAGTWYSDKYKETVYLTQVGYKLNGTCDTRGYTHSMSGTVSGNTATYDTTRTNGNSRCTTVMFGTAELLDNCSKLKRVVYSTDGNCDLSKSFTNEVIYDLK